MDARNDRIAWGSDGLIPAVVQDASSGEVLMLAWQNREALDLTLETGLAHFWSRSRGRLWRKGETSGNRMLVNRVNMDCDVDAVLLQVTPEGPACHTGERSCFFESLDGPGLSGESRARFGTVVGEVFQVVSSRLEEPCEGSYTAKLARGGEKAVLRKIAEEACEVILAAACEGDARVIEESADLLFHLIVLLAMRRLSTSDVAAELERRTRHRRAPTGN